jgi:chromosome segregation ATPase
MTAATESDLKRLEDLIINGQAEIKADIAGIQTDIKALSAKVDGIDKRLVSIETRLEDWKPSIDKTADLAEKVGELKNWRSIAFLILGAVAGWFARASLNNP